jgi:N-acetylglucosamine kinase-like BadF-type ATPase
MSTVFIAVDTGGTRTNVEVYAPDTEWKTRRFSVRATLSGALPVADYAAAVRKIFAPVDNYWQEHDVPDQPVYVFIGSAGFAAPTRAAFLEVLHETMPEFLSGNIRAAGISNDTFSLVAGYKADGAVIAGTGSNVLVRDRNNEFFQAGGHDWVAADYGAGYWVGLGAIRRAAKDFESGEGTVLLDRFCEVYNIYEQNEDEIIAKFRALAIADSQLKSDIAKFAAAVCSAAELGDLDAQNIVKQEAEDLADSLARTMRRRFSSAEISQGATIVQCGSLLANDFYRTAFESQVRMRLSAGTGTSEAIKWEPTKNGLSAVMNLARRLPGDVTDLLECSTKFRPVIVRF